LALGAEPGSRRQAAAANAGDIDRPLFVKGPPELTIEAIAVGIFELCLTYTAQGHVRELTELAPWMIYFALAPFVGPELAARVATERPQ
jgi:hypothetical protein